MSEPLDRAGLPRKSDQAHRNADMDVFVDAFWMTDEQRREIEGWLDDCMTVLDAYGNGETYQNYLRLSQTDYRQRYWAEQFPKLLAIKRKYDPKNFFHYVSPEKGGNPSIERTLSLVAPSPLAAPLCAAHVKR
jgi:hypothetical protein